MKKMAQAEAKMIARRIANTQAAADYDRVYAAAKADALAGWIDPHTCDISSLGCGYFHTAAELD